MTDKTENQEAKDWLAGKKSDEEKAALKEEKAIEKAEAAAEVDPYAGLTPGRAATLRAHDAKRAALAEKRKKEE